MKKIWLLTLLFPLFAQAQCEKYIGGDLGLANALLADVEKGLESKLTVDRQPSFINAADADGYVEVRIQFDMKTQMKNGQPEKVANGIKRVFIRGPWDKIEPLYNDYFLPKIKGCRKAENEQTDVWEGHRLHHIRQGQQKGISLGSIEITKG